MTNEISFKDQLLIFFHELIQLAAIKTHDSTWLHEYWSTRNREYNSLDSLMNQEELYQNEYFFQWKRSLISPEI